MFATAWKWLTGGVTRWALIALAILSGAIYEREKGKRDGEQIAAGKAAQEIQKSAQVANQEQVKAQELPPGEAQKQLAKEWNQ
jgi:hypothetical protein